MYVFCQRGLPAETGRKESIMTIASNAKLRLSSTQLEQEEPALNWLDYFGLNESPFQSSARLSMFYSLPRLESIIEQCLNMDSAQPLCLVTGMIGSGKSSLMRQMLSQIDRTAQVCAVKGGVTYSVNELLEAMTEDFCLPISSGRTIQSRLNQYLASMDLGRQYYLIIDDAHDLPLDTLAALMHFCVAKSKDTDFVLCLFGEQSLNNRIDSLMNKRGTMSDTKSFCLDPMSLSETECYLKYRCLKAGLEKNLPLSISDIARVHRLSGGVPGRVNRVAQQVMVDIMKREVHCHDERSSSQEWASNPLDDDSLGLRWFAVSLFVALVCCTVWLFYGANNAYDFKLAESKPVASKGYLALASAKPSSRSSAATPVPVEARRVAFVGEAQSTANKRHPWSLDRALDAVNSAVIQSIQPKSPDANQEETSAQIRQDNLHQSSAGEVSTVIDAMRSGRGYALQILAVRHQSSVPESLRSSSFARDIHEVNIHINGEDWRLILLGYFQSREEASQLLRQLPEELQQFKPWVRSFASLKNTLVD